MWFRVSNAFERSRNILMGVLLLSMSECILSESSKAACSVDLLGLNPYWLEKKRLLLWKC